MRILIIDDKPEERTLAEEAARSKGLEYVLYNPKDPGQHWLSLMEGVDGIVTDLFWITFAATARLLPGEKLPPSGLLVVIEALKTGKPVVICTDAAKIDPSRGHHGGGMGWMYDRYVKYFMFREGSPPFGWDDNKDWVRAMDQIIEMVSGE